ncbi:MAG: hypothetical protein ACE5Q6_13350 [Dehalococcoidia bacterium]
MQRSPLVRLLMSQERVNDLRRQLKVALVPGGVPSPEFQPCQAMGGGVAELQEEIDREVRASLVVSWLGLSDPPADWGWR